MDQKSLALEYFLRFSCKDIQALDRMFAEGCCLRDWENQALGKADTLKVYEKIFASVDQISVTPGFLYEDGDTVIAELLISIDGKERILVTDILQFTDEGKIVGVRAYKG